MFLKRIFAIKSVKDFFYMFTSNIVKKLIGFLREMILAYVFGTSLIYSFFLLLRTIPDLLSQFTFGNALQANLLPKLTKHFNANKNVSYNNLFLFTKRSLVYLFIITQVIQLIIIWQLNTEYTLLLIVISVLLTLLVIANFFNSIFLTVLQAEGKFKQHSVGTTLNLFISTFLLYPLTFICNIFGIVFSRLIGVLFLARVYIYPIFKRKESNEIKIGLSDFSFSILLLGNFSSLLIMLSRFIAGTDGDNNIAYFNYSIVLLNVVLTAIIANVNTLMLRKLSINKEIKWLVYSLLVALFFGVCLYLLAYNFSDELINFIYHRGAFSLSDVQHTASYFRQMTIPIIILLISSVLMQPYFTLNINLHKRYSKRLSFFILFCLLIVLSVLFFLDLNARERSLYLLYVMSVMSLFLSFFVCFKYLKHED